MPSSWIPPGETTETDTGVDLLPISALQHFAYCPRQFALIHIERCWAENRFTAEGHVLHERANRGEAETRGDLHVARSVRLWSRRLRLSGIADVVEFVRVEADGVSLPGRRGLWCPRPVEYKRGRSKTDDWDRVQLCAQALCLEEMLGRTVSEGAIFYGQPRRRERVAFDVTLRQKTEDLAERMHRVWAQRITPAPDPGPKCDNCSLEALCMPHATRTGRSARSYLERMLDS